MIEYQTGIMAALCQESRSGTEGSPAPSKS